MNIYLQKLRGVLGLGLLWTPIWVALFFILLASIMLVFNPGGDADVGTLRMTAIIAWVGFVSGICFGALFAVAENGRALGDLALSRAALWGMLGSALFPVLTGRANQVFWTCPFGALIAVMLIMLARQAELHATRQPKGMRDAILTGIGRLVRDVVSPARANVLLLSVLSIALFTACGNNRAFDRAAWLQGDLRTRGRMCEDLVQRKILVGQPAAEAQRLLGPPNKDFGSVLAYSIDLGWPFKDPVHYGLQVHLDGDRKVLEVRIVD